MRTPLCVCLVALVVACSPAAGPPTAAAIRLTPAQQQAIGQKIWQNESGGTVDGLVAWNAGEEFPSLGIGHFIWYPAGFQGRFDESWPSFVAFASGRGVAVPAMARTRHCPWSSRQEFLAAAKGREVGALRQWLAGNISLQTDFIMARSRAALPKLLAAAPAADRARVRQNYEKVAVTGNGAYALIDYVNFKGDGTLASERYQGQGWGLLQVLSGMREVPAGQPAAAEFAASAKRMLDRRIANSPPARGEARWRTGWHRRCDTYAHPL